MDLNRNDSEPVLHPLEQANPGIADPPAGHAVTQAVAEVIEWPINPEPAPFQEAALLAPAPLRFALSAPAIGAKFVSVSFVLNGRPVSAQIEARLTLAEFLRDRLHLAATPEECADGLCGACTVLIDGRRSLACLTLAATLERKEVVTVEGLVQAGGGALVSAYRANGARECGHCTPGLLMSAAGFLAEPWPRSPQGIRDGMAGNRCECGAYAGMITAIAEVRSRTEGSGV